MRKAVGRSSCKKVPSATSTNKTGRLEVRPDGWCAAPCVACSLPPFRPNLASGQNSTIPLETRRFDHVLRGRTVKINATSTRVTRRGYRVSGICAQTLRKPGLTIMVSATTAKMDAPRNANPAPTPRESAINPAMIPTSGDNA